MSALSFKMRGRCWKQLCDRLLFNVQFLVKTAYFSITCIYFGCICMSVGVCTTVHMRKLRTTCRSWSWFFPSAMCVSRLDLRWSGLLTGLFSCWAFSLAPEFLMSSEEWLSKCTEPRGRFYLSLRYKCSHIAGKLWTCTVDIKALARGHLQVSERRFPFSSTTIICLSSIICAVVYYFTTEH